MIDEHDRMWPAVLLVFKDPEEAIKAFQGINVICNRAKVSVLYGAHQMFGTEIRISDEQRRLSNIEDRRAAYLKSIYADLGIAAGRLSAFSESETPVEFGIEIRVQADVFKRETFVDLSRRLINLSLSRDLQRFNRKQKIKAVVK